MDPVKVDLDEGRIFVEGEWLSEEELKYAIKTKISSDDFDVEHLAVSMKALQKVMSDSNVMEIRLSNGMYSNLKNISEDTGETPGSIVRSALETYLGGSSESMTVRGRSRSEPEPEPEPDVDEEPTPEPEPEAESESEDIDDDDDEDDMEIENLARRRRRSRR